MKRTTGACGALLAGLLGLALAWTVPGGAAANSDGPLPGFTGGFGEATCHACHFDAPEEPGEGELVLLGVPEAYEAGAEYPVTVTLRDPRLQRAGFQLTARFAGEGGGQRAGAGRQAGRLLAPGASKSPRVEVVEHGDPPVLYARQTRAGAKPVAAHEASWSLRWIAPDEPAGPVLFHAAGNAADYDDSAFGDVVHTRAVRCRPAAAGEPREREP